MTESVICRSLDVFLQKRGMTFVLWILVSSTSMSNIVKAECVPLPDCASIGYTETSCETQSVRCPFDITKLYCLPCDSSYQYPCNGTGQKGKGTACNGKYVECECSNGYKLNDNNGNCEISCSDECPYASDGECDAGDIHNSMLNDCGNTCYYCTRHTGVARYTVITSHINNVVEDGSSYSGGFCKYCETEYYRNTLSSSHWYSMDEECYNVEGYYLKPSDCDSALSVFPIGARNDTGCFFENY